MKFNYQSRTRTGEVQTGVIEASSREAALNLLQKHGVYVTFLEEIREQPFYSKKIEIFPQRVSRKEIVLFTRQLSVLFRSGVPLPESLLSLAAQTKNYKFRDTIAKIEEDIEGGSNLSQAFSRYPRLFSDFYINMIKAGEVAGKLSETLNYLADHLEREYNLNAKIKGATIYPIFVLIVFFVIFLGMAFFVLPNFAELLKEMEQDLPAITKFVIAAAEFLKAKGWIFLVIFFILVVIGIRYIRTKEGKENFDKLLLKIPLIEDLLKKIYLSRLAENLSTLISGGLPIARALEVAGEVVGNNVYKDIIFQTKEGVKRGENISSVFNNYSEEIPPFFVQMTVVGEKTGKLDESLKNVVEFYQKEVDRSLEALTGLLEPIMIVFLGIIVAGLVVSVFLPLYQTLGTF